MKELQISLTGKITDTNFDEWKGALIEQISSSKRDLKTDEDFALAEQDVKTLKSGEKALKAAKQSALDQAAEIQKLFDAIDEVSEEARQARLSLERQIKRRKEEIRYEIVDGGMQAIINYLGEQTDTFRSVIQEEFMNRNQLEDFTKGKRTYKSMQMAIDQVVSGVKAKIDARAKSIISNEKSLAGIEPRHASLFQDRSMLLSLEPEHLATTIRDRIAFYEEEQERQRAANSSRDTETETSDPEPVAEAPLPEPAVNTAIEARFVISIEVFADEADATEFLDELEGRFSGREMVGEITLTRG